MKTGLSRGAQRLLAQCAEVGLYLGRKPMTRKELERERAKRQLRARLLMVSVLNTAPGGTL